MKRTLFNVRIAYLALVLLGSCGYVDLSGSFNSASEDRETSESVDSQDPANNQAPTVTVSPDTVTGTAPLEPVTVTIVDENPQSVTVTAVADDTSLVAQDGLTLTGDGAERTLQVSPVAQATGSTAITVSATDEFELVGTATLGVTIQQPPQNNQGFQGRASGAYYGHSVAIDGSYAVIGAPGDATIDPEAVGNAVVAQHTQAGWSQVAELTRDQVNKQVGDGFGHAVDISGDLIVVGAPFSELGGDTDRGGVSVFERDANGSWNQIAQLAGTSDNQASNGFSVAVEGNLVLVGAPGADTVNAYRFSNDRSTVDIDTFEAPSGVSGERFGYAVAIDGNRAVVGAPSADTSKGRVYTYNYKSGQNTWQYEQVVNAPDGDRDSNDFFGISVALDDGRLIVGADQEGPEGAGAVYTYEVSNNGWDRKYKIAPPNPAVLEDFGHSVAIDGRNVVIGTPRQGVFRSKILNSEATVPESLSTFEQETGLGRAVSAADGVAVVGAPLTNSNTGRVHFFDLPLVE